IKTLKGGMFQWRLLLIMHWFHNVMVLEAMIRAFRQMKNQQTMPSWHSPPQVLQVLIMRKSQFDVLSYKTGLESVKARIVVYQQNEHVFEEDIKLLKLDVMLRDNALVKYRKKFKKAEQERDDLKLKLENFQTSLKNLNVSMPPSLVHDRYQSGEGYHVVPHPYTGTFMPVKPDLVFYDAHTATEHVPTVFNVESGTTKPNKDLSQSHRPSAPIIEDWVSDLEDESEGEPMHTQITPSFVQPTEHVKTPRPSVKPVEHHVPAEKLKKDILKLRLLNFKGGISISVLRIFGSSRPYRKKVGVTCDDEGISSCGGGGVVAGVGEGGVGSTASSSSAAASISSCTCCGTNIPSNNRKKVQKPVRNHAMRENHQHYARMKTPHTHRHVVPTSVLTRSRLVSLTAARPVTTVMPQTKVHHQRPTTHGVPKAHSPIRRPIKLRPSPSHSNFHQKVTTINTNQVNVVECVKGNWGNPQLALKDKGVIDSGCSRHMTGNISYLSDFEAINRGYVAFDGNPKGGKITGKGKIRIGKLDFDDVYFVKELNFNLFSVSQMCDKKNSVLFTDTD
nr:ribonuclease H-like domain-containing protein [Tanacetum cinerariifolium]